EIQMKNILYHFGKITKHTDRMIQVFHDIIGEFPLFDLNDSGKNPEEFVKKYFQATTSAIFILLLPLSLL
ncbi:2_t:CDS:1, partial [Scutellospora calospora]